MSMSPLSINRYINYKSVRPIIYKQVLDRGRIIEIWAKTSKYDTDIFSMIPI